MGNRSRHADAPTGENRTPVLAMVLIGSVLCYLLVSRYVLGTAMVMGNSMEPTFREGDRFLMCRWICRFGAIRRGDIVAIRTPWDEGLSVKRVVALPDEQVQIRDDGLYIDGRRAEEPYLPQDVRTGTGAMSTNVYEVEPDCYFVLGDNRPDSIDSRFSGAVKREWIVGRLLGG